MENVQFGCEELNPAELQQINGGGFILDSAGRFAGQIGYVLHIAREEIILRFPVLKNLIPPLV